MSTLIYNRIGLLRCQVLEYTRTPQWMGPDYLWTTYRLRVRGIYNPQVNAYNFSEAASPIDTALEFLFPFDVLTTTQTNVPITTSVNGAVRLTNATVSAAIVDPPPLPARVSPLTPPRMARGTNAPTTDISIRHKLMAPRAALVYAVGNTPILVVPTINAQGPGLESIGFASQTDAHNGPIPLACDVVQISGTKSFLIDFAVETYVNESYLYAITPSVLLSHRWEATEDIDQDYYSTRTIRGRAQFRSDRLLFRSAVPDDFRMSLFHPLPGQGWKRTAVQVKATEDGSALEYVLVDKQLAFTMLPMGVTRIECFQTVESDNLDVQKLGFGVMGRFETTLKFLIGAASENWALIGQSALEAINKRIEDLGAAVPLVTNMIVARVWGLSNGSRKALENVVVNIMINRFAASFGPGISFAANTHFLLTHDAAGQYVTGIAVKKTAFSLAAIRGFARLQNLPDLRGFYPTSDDTAGVLTNMPPGGLPPMGLPSRASATPPAVQRTGTRGTFVEELAAASLLAQDFEPTNPPTIFNSGLGVIDKFPP